MNQKRIKQLEFFRLVFSFVVLFSHIDYLEELKYTKDVCKLLIKPDLAVNYFFLLSGFGIYIYLHNNKTVLNISSFKDCICFANKKIKKTYPLYMVSLILALPTTLYNTYVFTNSILMSSAKLILKFVLCITLTQSLTSITDFSHAINGVCWFLSCIYICYIFVPVIYKKIEKMDNDKKIIKAFAATLIFMCFLFVLFIYIDNMNIEFLNMTINDLEYGHPIIRIGYLVLGMFISKLYMMKKLEINSNCEILLFILYLSYYLFRSYLSLNIYVKYMLDIIISCTLIIPLINGKSKVCEHISNFKISNAGLLSTIVFLFHYPINQLIGFIILYNKIVLEQISCFYLIAFVIEIGLDVIVISYMYKNCNKITEKFSKFLINK